MRVYMVRSPYPYERVIYTFTTADDDARKFLTAAVQQLESLLLLLKEEYKPVYDTTCIYIHWFLICHRAERLKYAIAHGRIPRDLLEFHFRKGQRYYYLDDNEDFVREPITLLYLFI
jgi:hypothetical protein